MNEHQLKTWPEYFEKVLSGEKTWEYRINDRDYIVGDILVLREWKPHTAEFTGRELRLKVTYVLDLMEYEERQRVIMSIIKADK